MNGLRKVILPKRIHPKSLILILFIGSVITITKLSHVTHYLRLEYLHQNMDILQAFVQQNYMLSVIAYISSYILASSCGLPGSSFFLIASGVLFGVFPGALFGIIGATIGATSLFLMSRYFIGSWVQAQYGDRLFWYNHEIERSGYYYLLMVRFLYILPFFLTNTLTGMTLVSLQTFIWTTAIGMIPTALVYAFAGQQLIYVSSIDSFLSPPFLAFAFFFGLKLLLVPFMYKYFKSMRQEQNQISTV